MIDTQAVTNFLSTTALEVGIKILAAIVFWIVGRWLIRTVIGLIRAAMNRSHIDATLTKYLGSIVSVMLNIVLILGILGYFGIQTTSFAALIAGAGLAIGAAWSGMLGNFAAGAFMLVLRPFKVGDFVGIGGVVGTVQELGLFGTTIVTPDNVKTILGNGKIFAETIQNFSALPVRRVDLKAQLVAGVDPLDAIARFTAALGTDPERGHRTRARSRSARDQSRRPGDRRASVHAHRPLLAGVFRCEPDDGACVRRSWLAGAEPRVPAPGLTRTR